MQLKQFQLKPFIWLMVALCYLQPAKAQRVENSLLDNIPAESLMFMSYIQSKKLPAETLSKLFGDKSTMNLDKFLFEVDELCFYGQNKGAFNHYTLRFKGLKNFSFSKADSLLKACELEVSELNASYAVIDGGKYRKGIFHFNKEHYELKLFTQAEPIDQQIKKQYDQLVKQLHSDEYSHYEVALKLDSLDRLDSVNSAVQFKALMEQAKNTPGQAAKHPVNIKRIFDEQTDESAVITYLNTDQLPNMPFHLAKMFGSRFYDLYERLGMITGLMQYHQDVWIKLQGSNNQLSVTSIVHNKKKQKQLYQPLDKNLIKYLPANASALYSYNMQLSAFKNYLAKYYRHNDMREKEQVSVKLALLAFDDQLADALGNGFIALTDTFIDGRGMPDFKLALHMPDKQKGETLLSILEHDLKIMHKTDDHCYRFSQRKLDTKKPVYLNTSHDVWLMGTDTFEGLEQTLTPTQLKQFYPGLVTNKTSQYFYIGEKALVEFEDINIKNIELKTRILDKTRAKTTILIDL